MRIDIEIAESMRRGPCAPKQTPIVASAKLMGAGICKKGRRIALNGSCRLEDTLKWPKFVKIEKVIHDIK